MRREALVARYMGHKEKEHLLELLTKILASRPEPVFAVVFGGFLEDRPFRDLDIGIYLSHTVRAAKDVIEASLYAEELASDLSSLIGLPVDVVVLNHAPIWLLHRALRGRVLVDRDPIFRIKLYLMALDNMAVGRWHVRGTR
ncbi:nucleotidyltransferase domain-containing protein [Candidatus Bathyarchaeota archaeon]|nr:MAG: nucleotidyltransferase domain-containing protein [Candidatus Bathyarchaeota archaeon]